MQDHLTARGAFLLSPEADRATDPTGTASRSTTEWSSVAAQPVYRGVSRRMAASACRSPADRGTHTGPEGYREIAEVGVGAEAVRREPAPEAGARSGVEPPAVAGAGVFRRLPERSAAIVASRSECKRPLPTKNHRSNMPPDSAFTYGLINTMRRGRTYRWTRMRRSVELSSDMGLSSPCQSCQDSIIATRGYSFQEGQPTRKHRNVKECRIVSAVRRAALPADAVMINFRVGPAA